MIRSASFLPIPGIAVSTAWSPLEDRQLQVGHRPAADDREGDLRPDAGHRQEEVEEAELLGRPEAEQRLPVLADEVVGVELELRAGGRRADHRRRGEHPVADARHLDDEGIRGDRADEPSTEAITGRSRARASRDGALVRASCPAVVRLDGDAAVEGRARLRRRSPGAPVDRPLAVGGPDRDRQGVGSVVRRRHAVRPRMSATIRPTWSLSAEP